MQQPDAAEVIRRSQDHVARGLAALALVAILALIVLTLQKRPPVEPIASPTELASIRELGNGVTVLIIEEFHRRAWSRYHFTLDTAQSVEKLQTLADDLHLPIQIQDVVGNRRLLAFVSTGGALPRSLEREVGRRFGGRARDVFEVSCQLGWISLQGAVIPQYFGNMRDQLTASYLESYPVVAHRINTLGARLGLEKRLEETWPGDPDKVTERCWEIGEELDRVVKNSQ